MLDVCDKDRQSKKGNSARNAQPCAVHDGMDVYTFPAAHCPHAEKDISEIRGSECATTKIHVRDATTKDIEALWQIADALILLSFFVLYPICGGGSALH